MELWFATSNTHKFNEARELLPGLNHFPFSHNEIRSDSLEEIASEAVQAAYDKLKKPVFVDDSGLFINSLNGFPGTYSAWAFKKISNEGILALLAGKHERQAYFGCVLAFHDGKEIHLFTGRVDGEISSSCKGNEGFGYDPLFIPKGESQTFAQNKALKTKLSHRYNALVQLKGYLRVHGIL